MTAQSQKTLLVTGSTIGQALLAAYERDPAYNKIIYTFRSSRPELTAPKIDYVQLDLTNESEVAELLGSLPTLDGVINTVGLLHSDSQQPEKSISRLEPQDMVRSFELNTVPTLLLAKHSRSLLRQSGHSFFAAVSAKVGSIEDNRLGGWYSYRASKAALNMSLKTLAIEWRHAVPKCAVAALHPGTVSSPLSEPFTRRSNKVFTPEESADYLKHILDRLSPEQTGKFWNWDGKELPW